MTQSVADAFVDDIIANPADDTPRLIYADWLEDNGQPERGEFIRVQIELAENQRAITAGKQDSDVIKWMKKHDRERELLYAYGSVWLCQMGGRWASLANPCIEVGRPAIGFNSPFNGSITFTRGFVSEVRCRLVDWIGETCGWCGGHVTYLPPGRQTGGPRYPFEKCAMCVDGRINAHGPAIMACQPVERVTTEMSPQAFPYSSPNDFGWIKKSIRNDEEFGIPDDVWELLSGHRLNGNWKDYDTEQAALDALSVALLAFAKGVRQ